MKFFQNRFVNIILLIIFVCLLVLLHFYGSTLGIKDINTLILNSILLLLATLITISLPLYAAFINEREQNAKDTKMVIIAVSRYIGNEILDNIVTIEDIVANNKKSLKDLESQAPFSEDARKMTLVGMWSAASEELVVSLEDKQHQSIVQSGLVAKIDSNDLADGIRSTYQKMDNLKKRLRQLSKFCNMLLSPPQNIPEEFTKHGIDSQFPQGVKAVETDIEIFKKEADKTIKEINKLLKPYGQEIKIVEYENNSDA